MEIAKERYLKQMRYLNGCIIKEVDAALKYMAKHSSATNFNFPRTKQLCRLCDQLDMKDYIIIPPILDCIYESTFRCKETLERYFEVVPGTRDSLIYIVDNINVHRKQLRKLRLAMDEYIRKGLTELDLEQEDNVMDVAKGYKKPEIKRTPEDIQADLDYLEFIGDVPTFEPLGSPDTMEGRPANPEPLDGKDIPPEEPTDDDMDDEGIPQA